MNRNQTKGALKQAAGKVQQKVGKVTGSHQQQAKGAAKQMAGTVQRRACDIQNAVSRADKRTRADRAA